MELVAGTAPGGGSNRKERLPAALWIALVLLVALISDLSIEKTALKITQFNQGPVNSIIIKIIINNADCKPNYVGVLL